MAGGIRKGTFPLMMVIAVLLEAVICIVFVLGVGVQRQDVSAMNDCIKTIESNYGYEEGYPDTLAYTIIDLSGKIMYKSDGGASSSILQAAAAGDAVFELQAEGSAVGTVIFKNSMPGQIKSMKSLVVITILVFTLIQIILVSWYFLYLRRRIITPFCRLEEFAVRVAGGDLDIPLDMDRGHIFGGFSEAFDLMRSELKKAKLAEKKANDEKKEIVAKLSHDIKTPVASIRATSELGYALAGDEKTRECFSLISMKADQVKTLSDNLFNSSVQEITQIAVNPVPQPSSNVERVIRNADYLNKAGLDSLPGLTLPDCKVYADKLRLQQVFDNIFTNSYKYADTDIDVMTDEDDTYLYVTVRDHGPGVKDEELPLLKEKFRRGSNISGKEGAGLGLYLADYFMSQMDGKIEMESRDGFSVRVCIRKAN